MPPQKSSIYLFGDYRLKVSSRTLERNGQPLALGSKAFEVLTCLVVNAGEVVTKAELLRSVWPGAHVEEGTLSQHVFSLRKALGEDAHYIVTVPGSGYQFTAPVQQMPEASLMVPLADGVSSSGTELRLEQVRERTHIVIETVTSPPPQLQLAAPERALHPLLRTGLAVTAALLLALAAWGTWAWTHRRPSGGYKRAVVADIVNSTGDSTFDGTLKRALQIDLEQSPYVDVMSEQETASTLQLMGTKATTPMAGETAREVCLRSNRQVVLTASVSPVGSEFLLTLEAADCISGRKLGAAKARADSREHLFAALDAVTERVRSQLGESRLSVENYQVPIAEATTPSLDALKAYSIGSMMEAEGRSESDILPLFQRAVELDPNFAMAYNAMGTQYYNLSEFKLASQAYSKAFALSGRVSAKEKLAIEADYYAEGQEDLDEGIRVYKLWTLTYPNDWLPWKNLADEYTRIGQYVQAVEAGQQALKLAPDRPINYGVLVRAYKRAGRYGEAKALAQTALDHGKSSTVIHGLLYVIAWQEHDAATLARETQWGESAGWYGFYLEALAKASEGRYAHCAQLFRHAVELANEDNVSENADGMLTDEAAIELQFGLKAQARETLAHIGQADRDLEELAKARAMMGDEAPAEAYLRAHEGQPGTILTYLKLPQLRAELALLHNKPMDAVVALEPARPYELAGYDIPSLRGEAYLQAHQPQLAVAEYRKVLANPGISFGPLYPMAHLGLARAYAALGQTPESRAEYQNFLTAWKDADPGLPLLKAAQTELAELK